MSLQSTVIMKLSKYPGKVCGMYSTGSQFSSAFTIGSHLLSGIVFLVTRLLIFWSSLSDFGLLWSPISPFGLQGGLSGATCSHCHQTEKGFLDCGFLCLEWSSL